MCGIFGFRGDYPEELLKVMAGTMAHRGPDESGFFYREGTGVGNVRLSIVDLQTGSQPLFNEDRSLVLVFNGEIYNHLELRELLTQKGHRFVTKTDSEVVVHAYEEYGTSCLDRLNGMFAFAIWDSTQSRFFLARDRLGIKPLYYTRVNGDFLFASELKALLQCEAVNRTLDFRSIDDYLTFRYVPGNRTFFAGIRKLPPAHFLAFQEGKETLRPYWHFEMKEDRKMSEEAFVEEFYNLLKDSVRLQLMGDVPIGAFLSGGLDSSAVVSLVAALDHAPRKTFSVGFGTSQDETASARHIADLYATDHHEVEVKPDDFFLLPKIVWHLDEPVGDAIVVPTYLLSQIAHRHVKVVLTGEGADELLGGYVHQDTLLRASRIPPRIGSALGRFVEGMPVSLIDRFFQYPASMGTEGRKRLAFFLRHLGDTKQNYLHVVSLFTGAEKDRLYTGQFKEVLTGEKDSEDVLMDNETDDIPNWLLRQELTSWLPDNILFKQDKLTMAHSVEGRVPYLDHRIVELMGRVPFHLKIHGGVNKILLRRAFKGILPPETTRRRKQAFFMPLEGRFQSVFRKLCSDYLSVERIKRRGWFEWETLRSLLEKADSSPLIYHKQLMALLILEIWLDVFVDQKVPCPREAVTA